MLQDRKKIVVLGLDGASWDLLDPLMEKGLMPNLKRIVGDGVSGILESTIPPYTAPAWVSCITGVNPGKHGIFGFTLKNNGVAKGEFVDSSLIRMPKLWDWINEAGKTVGLINIPITYPAGPVDGFVVPCFLTPLGKEDYTYPPSIYRDFLLPLDYVINVRIGAIQGFSEEIFVKTVNDVKYMAQRRCEVMEALRAVYNPDFLMIVFTALDKVQHKFWKYLDPRDQMYETAFAQRFRPLLLSVYEQMDGIIGRILDKLDNNSTLYIVSDHGFGPQKKNFFMNKWLANNGFLKVRKTSVIRYRFLLRSAKRLDFFARNVDVFNNPIYECVHYGKSSFIGSDPYEQGVYFIGKACDSEYSDKISKLKQKLGEVKDPETGMYLFERVYHREELYTGNHTNKAPDIILRLKDYGYNITRGFPLKNKIFNRVEKPAGCHRPAGIFVAYGKDIVPGKETSASIMDVTPTVLYEMGLPVHSEMDGKARKEIFSDSFQDSHEMTHAEAAQIPKRRVAEEIGYSDGEKEEIAGRLKDLGYLD
ncbi:MAG: alkaline phosphatase family protein [Candidatus Hodarchaeota archaeon]